MKRFISSLIAVAVLGVAGFTAHAALKGPADTKFILNNMGSAAQAVQLGTQLVEGKRHVLKAVYDYSVLGGASTTLTLRGPDNLDAVIPDNAIVRDVLIDVLTAPTSATSTATVALQIKTASDLLVPTTVTSVTGLMEGALDRNSSPIKLTADSNPKVVIASEDLTGGKFNVFLEYDLSD